jgi:hypothetical protein
MNERIIKLANEANKDISYTFKMEEAKQLHELMEKFAELIVRECIGQVWYTREDGINGNISQVIKDRMKQHFGVEL